MTRVLLLNPPCTQRVSRDYYCGHACKGRYYWPQFDLLALSGRLHEGGCTIDHLDAIVHGIDPQRALAAVEAFRPDAVIAVTAAISWSEDAAFLAEVKRRCGATILVSGDYSRAAPRRVLDAEPWLDGVILDFADCDVVSAVTGAARTGLRNVYLRDDVGPARVAPEKRFSFPIPRHELFVDRAYRLPQLMRRPFTLVITDFGCPYQCDYCYFQRVAHKRRDMESLRAELAHVRSLGIRELLIHDPSFAAVKEHGLAVCDVMRSVANDFSWACGFRADSADEELVRAMRAAGCHTLMFGVESPNEAVMAKHRKPQTVDEVDRAFALARRLGMRTLAHFVIGLSGETRESIGRLIDYAIALDPDIASFNIARPAWNTGFRDEVVDQGWLLDDRVEIATTDSLPIWESPDLSRLEMWQLRNEAVRRFYLRPRFVLRQLGGVRTPYQFGTLVREGCQIVADALRHALKPAPVDRRAALTP